LVSRSNNELPSASDRAAVFGCIAFRGSKPVFCPRRHSRTATVGTLEKTNPVSLCVPDARGYHVQETRDVSQVQDEVGPESDQGAALDRIKLGIAHEEQHVYSPL